MAERIASFTESTARRLVKAAKRVEGMPLGESPGPRQGKSPQHRRCRFKLTASLTAGGSASAVFRIWNGSTWADTTTTLTVYDAEGDKTGSAGMHGRAETMSDSGLWEIYYLECEAA